MKKIVSLLLLIVLVMTVPAGVSSARDETPGRVLVPIGGGYSDVYSGLCATIAARAQGASIRILVLPATYSTNAESITEGERALNLSDAEVRRYEIQEACRRAGSEGQEVSAVIAPVFTRADAGLDENVAYFTDEVTAVFILGGDQTVAMRSLAGTPVEAALAAAYARGAVVAGTSAGGGMLSRAMIAGYRPNFAAESALEFGGVDLWNGDDLRGLSFALPNAILDQHFFQRARLGRLLAAVLLPEGPHLGVGIDAYTGVRVYDERTLGDVFGLYTVTVLDAETYRAYATVAYSGEENRISARNVLVHMLAEAGSSYDLVERRASLAPVPAALERDSDFLALPEGAGPLFLGGGLIDSPLLAEFGVVTGGETGSVLVVATGYRSGTAANAEARKFQDGLGVPSQVLFVPSDQVEPIALPAGTTGILVIGKDQSLLAPAALAPVADAWRAGTPVLLDNAAAALAGNIYSAHPPSETEGEQAEADTQRSFLLGRTDFADGLGLLPAMFEPQLVNNNRWGRLFSLAYNVPERVVFGLTAGSALRIDENGPTVAGEGSVFSLDLRAATLGLGTNEGFEIANGMLDVFQPGEAVRYETADAAAAGSAPAATPDLEALLATPTPTPTATSTPELDYGNEAGPATPVPEPAPAAGPAWVLLAVFAVIIAAGAVLALVGWIRKKR